MIFSNSVTFDGSLTLVNRIFTASLYDPTSQDFMDTEREFCQMVRLIKFHSHRFNIAAT